MAKNLQADCLHIILSKVAALKMTDYLFAMTSERLILKKHDFPYCTFID
jgi:hypothetical protein